jgi:hypothetical protein
MFASSAQAVRTDPVDRVDAPLAAGDPREACGAGAVLGQAGDGVHDFLAGQGAVGVVVVPADPGYLAGVRKAGALGIGDPDGAADDPPVAAIQLRVVGVAGKVPLDGVEDGPLQSRLVFLDNKK